MVYLDYNATTPLDVRVLARMNELPDQLANPGSIQHKDGRFAEYFLENSRAEIAHCLGFSVQEVILNSGASESAAISLYGFSLKHFSPALNQKKRILTTRLEHKAVLETLANIERITNISVEFVPVTIQGLVNIEALRETLAEDVLLGCFMSVNNETGVVQDLNEIADALHQVGALLVSDFTQAVGKIPLDGLTKVDAAFLSTHKIYGPAGVGVLVVRRLAQKQMFGLLHSGGQERGLRGGTQNVRGAVGAAESIKIAISDYEENHLKHQKLKFLLLEELKAAGVDFAVNGDPEGCVANTVNLYIPGVDGDELLANCQDLSVSTGSACNSANPEPSHVLLGMGLGFTRASQSVRFSFGRTTTETDVLQAASIISAYSISLQSQAQRN